MQSDQAASPVRDAIGVIAWRNHLDQSELESVMSFVLGTVNQKGGVAKTTTAVAIAGGLAERGHKVLFVDTDASAVGTVWLASEVPAGTDALGSWVSGEATIISTSIPRVDLLPASPSLSEADVVLGAKMDGNRLLAKLVDSVRDSYDFVVIDGTPSIAKITQSVLFAADGLIAPVEPSDAAMRTLPALISLANEARSRRNGTGPQWLGMVFTRVDNPATKVQRGYMEGLPAEFPEIPVIDTVVRKRTAHTEAMAMGRAITFDDPSSKAALEYRPVVDCVERASQLSVARSAA